MRLDVLLPEPLVHNPLTELTCVEERVVRQRHSVCCVETDSYGRVDGLQVTDPQHQVFHRVLSGIHI